MKDITLVIMAAGIGSRYGNGIKQLEQVGPSGELIMDYSVHDAIAAGFNKVVFILRRDIVDEFHKRIGKNMEKLVKVEYVFQDMYDVPEGVTVPEGRVKPWGTGQAVLSCRGVVKEPFAVINADDYYGAEPFAALYEQLEKMEKAEDGKQNIFLMGYRLGNTLSDNGTVTRGICHVDEDNMLVKISETRNLQKDGENGFVEADGVRKDYSGTLPVSMNMWGFDSSFIDLLAEGFEDFFKTIGGNELKAEFLIPEFVDRLLSEGKAKVRVIDTDARWFGVTYAEDKATVVSELEKLVEKGVYKRDLYA